MYVNFAEPLIYFQYKAMPFSVFLWMEIVWKSLPIVKDTFLNCAGYGLEPSFMCEGHMESFKFNPYCDGT